MLLRQIKKKKYSASCKSVDEVIVEIAHQTASLLLRYDSSYLDQVRIVVV